MTAPQEWLLQGTGIGLARGGRKILVNVDFTLNRGEILTVIGPNGAGKTTLLRLALGLIAPTTGQIKRQPSLTIGYMPQKLHLDATFPLTVRRFLSSARSGIPTEQLVAALTETGVPHLLEASMQTLSGGETQRVLLARTLLRQPDLLVLDEPVQGVDINGQIELYRLIGQIRDRHRCGILMVSHDLHLVMAATDRVICIDQHICCSGTPATISSDPTYIRMYGQLALYQHDQIHHQQHRSNRDV